LRFAASAYSWRDLPNACVVGLARESPFDGSGALTKFAAAVFPSLGIRPCSLAGRRVWVDTNDLGQLVSYEEVFVDRCYDLGRVPFGPHVVIDCGAHVGFFSALVAARFPEAKVIAIEPNPDNCKRLRRQCERLDDRICIFEAAAGLEDGYASFTAEFSNSGRLVQDANEKSILVKTVSLQRLLAEVREPLLLKMDVEGAEESLLPCCLPMCKKPTALFLETHHGSGPRIECTELLKKHGFSVDWIRVREPYADCVALKV
jgi:FkbM family methyltransferase